MKNILVPTDFSIRSLGYVHSVVEKQNGEPVNIVLMHALKMPDSIIDLLQFGRGARHYELITAEFREACEILKNKYASAIGQLSVEFFVGTTNAAFRNFLAANSISAIACPTEDTYQLPDKESFNPIRLIRKCKYPLVDVHSVTRKPSFVRASISDLLLANT
ncbi:hypothetical protein MKQ68_21455 [Chitinophaga horti]|uniref:Universal stress protein n=1 Tax=Chitinophaga horti TaxID=2920382 RepID=A0ABY6IZE2_9BACT|nr:hypothetical protein [Chitinophaga horti]UYQ92650.1 hypothetical protein MKQ68_21455 [Chitinophaga horti]